MASRINGHAAPKTMNKTIRGSIAYTWGRWNVKRSKPAKLAIRKMVFEVRIVRALRVRIVVARNVASHWR